MGKQIGVNKAEILKVTANAKQISTNQTIYNSLYKCIIKAAKIAAEDGRYEYTFYDNKLRDSSLMDELKHSLKTDGFKVKGGIDSVYSENVNENMYYISISWK